MEEINGIKNKSISLPAEFHGEGEFRGSGRFL